MAEPLVLLPGMMCDARLFGPQIAELSADTAVMCAPVTQGDRIALIATNPLAELPAVAAEREPQIVRVRSGRMLEVMRDEMKPDYLAPGAQRQDVLDLVMDMAETLGPEVFIRQSRALQRRRDQQAILRKCKVPALVLCGAHDALCPVKRHTFMAELIPYAKLTVLEHAGHLPTLEQPAETTAALRDWMAQPLVLQ